MISRLQEPLHLVELRQGHKQELTVVVRHAVANYSAENPVGRHASDIMSAPIVYAESETFEIFFPQYFAYLVSDESGFPPEEGAVFEGAQFRRYQKSRFLEFIERAAYSDDVRPHPLYHYGIYCLNDLVDVVAPKPPHISYVGMTSR